MRQSPPGERACLKHTASLFLSIYTRFLRSDGAESPAGFQGWKGRNPPGSQSKAWEFGTSLRKTSTQPWPAQSITWFRWLAPCLICLREEEGTPYVTTQHSGNFLNCSKMSTVAYHKILVGQQPGGKTNDTGKPIGNPNISVRMQRL